VREYSSSSCRDTIFEIAEEERLRTGLAWIVERKELVQELQRLEEEEKRLAKIEEELRQQTPGGCLGQWKSQRRNSSFLGLMELGWLYTT
jgi:hypothetical protein